MLSLCEQGYHYTNGGQMPCHNRTEQPVGSNGQSPLVVGALPLNGRNMLQALPLYSRSMLRTQPLKSRSMLQAKPLKSRSMLRTQPLNDHILPFNGHQQFRDRLRHVQPELRLHGIVLGVYQRLCYCCRHKTPSELLPDTRGAANTAAAFANQSRSSRSIYQDRDRFTTAPKVFF